MAAIGIDINPSSRCHSIVANTLDRQRGSGVSVVICLDGEVLDRAEGILRHVLVGLVDQSIAIRLVSSDRRVDSLALGPIQAFHHEPLTLLFRGSRIRRLVESLGAPEPSIVHAVSWRSFDVAMRLTDAFDAELVVHLTSLHDCEHLARLPSSKIAHVIAVSEPLRVTAIDQLKFSADKVTLIRPGLSVVPQPTCFSFRDRRPTILCTTPFERGAGVERVIEAMDAIRAKGQDVLTFLMGEGPLEDDLRRMLREKQLSASVMFAEPLADRTAAMHGADIFIRPNGESEFAFDALHAMAMGLAVVTFSDPLNDFFQAGKTAFVCEPGSSTALAQCIEALLNDRDKARSTAKSALDYLREHHSMNEMAERTAAIYRNLAMPHATFTVGERGK
ncbi:MAG: glycosyltransferase family 4 protein [Planctomycetes bacterium]|nr:glycosyltransferase family 4 protein [Planctomycetota bacterium]MBI3834560.1 glycosyltransferase family 4 protein [Planctomycetota bacterium]